MEYIQKLAQDVISGLSGNYGNAGVYGSFLRVFCAFGLLSGPASSLIDAPFGRSVPQLSTFNVNGSVGWLLMEIVSPISFVVGLSTRISSNPITLASLLAIPSLETVIAPFTTLPRARVLLASLFLLHYFNRSIVSTFRNPGRAAMNISVPISATIFNVMNGFLMGMNIGGGGGGDWTTVSKWGIDEEAPFEALFILGIGIWTFGFLSNIYCDEILYSLKRNRPKNTIRDSSHWTPHRYSIPHGWLYSYPFGGVSSASYFSEWLEWSGYALAAWTLNPAPFPLLALSPPSFFASFVKRPTIAMNIVRSLPEHLKPFDSWFLSPPVLFLLNEISAMLPRALSTHNWYKKTFGREYPRERKAIIPGML